MDTLVTFRHLPPSEALKSFVVERARRVERLVRPVGPARVVLDVERHTHCAEVLVPVEGQLLVAKAERTDLYEAIDAAIDSVCEQARRRHSRAAQHRTREPRRGMGELYAS